MQYHPTVSSPIAVGMARKAVRERLNSPLWSTYKVAFDSVKLAIDAYNEQCLLVYYDRYDVAVGIEYWRGSTLTRNEINLLTLPFSELVELLREEDAELMCDSLGFVSNTLGIASYAPIGSAMGECVESIYLFKPGHYGVPIERENNEEELELARQRAVEVMLLLQPFTGLEQSGAFKEVMQAALASVDIMNPFRIPLQVPYLLMRIPPSLSRELWGAIQMTLPCILMDYSHYRLSSTIGRSPVAELARRAPIVGPEHLAAIKEIRSILARIVPVD